MDQAEKRQKMLVADAIAAVVLALGDFMVLTPLTNAWQARAKRIEDLKAKVAKGQLTLDRETSTRARWDKYKRRGLTVDRAGSESDVLKMVNDWSGKSRFNVSSIRPSWRDDEKDHVRLLCRVAGDGSVESIARFLFQLDAEETAIRVETIELTARDKDGQRLGVDLEFSALQIVEEKEPEKKKKS